MICARTALVVAMAALPLPAQSITVELTGQSMLRSDLRVSAPATVPAIRSMLAGADVIFTNFEGTVADRGQPNAEAPIQGRGFIAPPEAIEALKTLGFNLLALSDNHSFDLKVPGIENTLSAVNRWNLAHAGIGKNLDEAAAPGYLKTPKGTIALVAMASGLIPPGAAAAANRPGVNELRVEAGNKPNAHDAQMILAAIRTAAQKADLVVAYQHNHVFDKPFAAIFEEGMPERLRPPDWIRKWTHEEIDAGADIVVMHGAPLLHGIEIYKGRPIFYDLGNFIYNLPLPVSYIQEPMAWESAVATVEFDAKRMKSIKLRPIVLNFIGEGQPDAQDAHVNNLFLQTRGLPKLATGEKAGYILQRLAEYANAFGTRIEIKGDAAEIRPAN